jgi:hypothetical protein
MALYLQHQTGHRKEHDVVVYLSFPLLPVRTIYNLASSG